MKSKRIIASVLSFYIICCLVSVDVAEAVKYKDGINTNNISVKVNNKWQYVKVCDYSMAYDETEPKWYGGYDHYYLKIRPKYTGYITFTNYIGYLDEKIEKGTEYPIILEPRLLNGKKKPLSLYPSDYDPYADFVNWSWDVKKGKKYYIEVSLDRDAEWFAVKLKNTKYDAPSGNKMSKAKKVKKGKWIKGTFPLGDKQKKKWYKFRTKKQGRIKIRFRKNHDGFSYDIYNSRKQKITNAIKYQMMPKGKYYIVAKRKKSNQDGQYKFMWKLK